MTTVAIDQEVSDFLEHFGVKGMKWGVRNDRDSGSVYRFQGAQPKIDSTIHASTQSAGKEVAALIGSRYGFNITSINAITPDNPEYTRSIAYVKATPGVKGGDIYVAQADIRKRLKEAENSGWLGKDCGTVQSILTHETAHAIFHAEQQMVSGFFKPKIVGGERKARDKAIQAAITEAQRSGIPHRNLPSKISGYAGASGTREEAEAEMFSQYHWSSNPPSFVKVWGETLHREMGIDPTPFRKAG